MKNILKLIGLVGLLFVSLGAFAQNTTEMEYFNEPGKVSLNTFETTKADSSAVPFDKVKVQLGGAFALQFQDISHSNDSGVPLTDIGGEFNLATANLNIDVQLADGVHLNLISYMSSKHHEEFWVKGGYFQIDKLPFLNSPLLDDVMQYVTVKIGHMEINYGDSHFRRTDNGNAFLNPFVGNMIMDPFATEIGGEVYFKKNGFLAMAAVTNGEIKGDVSLYETSDPSIYFKAGFDKQVTPDLRTRLTGSYYSTNKSTNNTLYMGDRTGSRYYYVMTPAEAKGQFTSYAFTGRFNPVFNYEVHSLVFNPFLKYKGLEFFGTAEFSKGRGAAEVENREATQFAGDLIYRFGKNENLYVAGRYNTVNATLIGSGQEVDINRYQLGAGWFLSDNIMAKVEYVSQEYKDFPTGDLLEGGKFDGFMLEAVISF